MKRKNSESQELQNFLTKWSKLPGEKISSLLQSSDVGSINLETLITALQKRNQLEAIGKVIHAKQLLHLLRSHLAKESEEHWKISPILVGLSHETFIDTLMQADEIELQTLQHASPSEALQHHLTLLAHDLRERLRLITRRMQELHSHILSLPNGECNPEEIATICHQIDEFTITYDTLILIINRGLSLAWHANRGDLIELMTMEKEECQRSSAIEIGHTKKGTRSSTGLFALLEEQLNHLYGDPTNVNDMNTLQDDEPAREALVKLSLWYLKDYWEMGLLPKIKKSEQLELPLSKAGAEERRNYREKLYETALENLAQAGLKTVGDFKKQQIYSKKALRALIKSALISV